MSLKTFESHVSSWKFRQPPAKVNNEQQESKVGIGVSHPLRTTADSKFNELLPKTTTKTNFGRFSYVI